MSASPSCAEYLHSYAEGLRKGLECQLNDLYAKGLGGSQEAAHIAGQMDEIAAQEHKLLDSRTNAAAALDAGELSGRVLHLV